MLKFKDIFTSNGAKDHMEVQIVEKLDSFAHEYKVQGKIGEGSFSEVLKCQDRHSGVYIAAKHLKKCFKSAIHAAELPELIALRKLARHPNILHMIESHYDSPTGRVTFIFELMDMSLYDLMKNRKRAIPESRAKNYLYQIIKGVAHIHHHGIFHRDIKPENILMKGELLKISDLGSVKGIYTRHPYTEYISTRWYRSPECLLTTGYYGPKMDVWAIGCVFFELLTLKPLFPGASELDQIARINNVIGTPNSRLMAKFRKHKCRNISVCFPSKSGSGLNQLIPLISEGGRDIMKQMIVYDPDTRSNIRRLSEHKYFLDIRESYTKLTQGVPPVNASNFTLTYRNPALLSYLTTEKKRKIKKKVTTHVSTKPSNITGATNNKLTEAKRNALLQHKLQQKQQELQQQQIEKKHSTNTVFTNQTSNFQFKVPIDSSKIETKRINLPSIELREQNDVDFSFTLPTIEKLKERLNATHQPTGREEMKKLFTDNKERNPNNLYRTYPVRLPPLPERKSSVRVIQNKPPEIKQYFSGHRLPPLKFTTSQSTSKIVTSTKPKN